jgi:ATP-dependent Clp protease ATP-binding subunit ClpA
MTAAGATRRLDPNLSSNLSKLLVRQLSNRVVGQEKATQVLVDMFESYRAGFCDPRRPAGIALFLGPTGTGKTHVVETFADALLGTKLACLRIDCAEFQHSHEVAKLIGSPPGYLGHRETSPRLTQEALDKYHTDNLKLSVVLFDEVEKASDALWSLLLGIMDKATLTLGDNRTVDFSKTIIVMTSNLGAREMANRGIGYVDPDEVKDTTRLEQIAVSAAKSKFTPEFMNRIQSVVTFHALTEEQIKLILDIELFNLAERLDRANLERPLGSPTRAFVIETSPKAKRTLIVEGYDKTYGARHLKRAIERRLLQPLAKMFNSGQIGHGDRIIVDDTGGDLFDFYVHPRPSISTL